MCHKRIIWIGLCLALAGRVATQAIVNTAGNAIASGNTYLDYAIGELVTTTSISSKIYTQGLLQPVKKAPPGWTTQPCNTGIVHTVAVLSSVAASIAGQPLSPGDLVGFFHTDAAGNYVCNNFGAWQGAALTLDLCGDDPSTPGEKEGFAAGENLLVRVYKNNAEYNVIACYVAKDAFGLNNPSHAGSFATNGLSYIECLKTAPDPGSNLGCGAPIVIQCGETKTGNSANGISGANTYNCFPNLVDGAEVVYQFTNTTTQNILITLTGLQKDLELLLLKPCDRNSCLEYSDRTGSSPEAIFVENLPAGTYFIVVEGYLGASSAYALSVQCSNNIKNGTLACAGAPAIACGQTLSGNTNTGSDQIIQYGCAPAYVSGKEKVYAFTTPANKVVQARLSGLTADLDLFVLDQCQPDACLGASNKSGLEEEGVIFSAAAGKTYYIVVDGYFDAEGAYTLQLNCFNPCTDPANCPYEVGGTGGQQCLNAQVLSCGVPVSGNNNTGQANAAFYACPNSYTNGKEVVYKFINPAIQDITIIMSGLSANLDLYLLNGCSIFNCLVSSHKSGNSNEGVSVQALPPGEYFIVVDGYNGAISNFSLVVNCSNSTLTCQSIDLVAGTNFISSNILPVDPSINAMFPPSAQSPVIAIENQYNQSYSPVAQSNPKDFDDWDFRKAYRIKTLQPTTVQVCGTKADPDTPIPYTAATPQGIAINNWIAYLNDAPAFVQDKFTPTATPNIFRVWNMPTGPNGKLTPQSYLVTLQSGTSFELETGRGYVVNASADGSLVLGFAPQGIADRGGESLPSWVENGCVYFVTPLQHNLRAATVILPKTLLEEYLTPGDEIGIFAPNGRLYGSGRYDDYGLSMVVSGDEPNTPDVTEGFAEGEAFMFKLWKKTNRQVYNLDITFQYNTGLFTEEGVYIASKLGLATVSATQTVERQWLWSLRPNPLVETGYADIFLPEASPVRIQLLALDGRVAADLFSGVLPEGRNRIPIISGALPAGLYLVRLSTAQGNDLQKIIISK